MDAAAGKPALVILSSSPRLPSPSVLVRPFATHSPGSRSRYFRDPSWSPRSADASPRKVGGQPATAARQVRDEAGPTLEPYAGKKGARDIVSEAWSSYLATTEDLRTGGTANGTGARQTPPFVNPGIRRAAQTIVCEQHLGTSHQDYLPAEEMMRIPGVDDVGTHTSMQTSKKAQIRRKATGQPAESSRAVSIRKTNPRKKFKSEAIILDSDEPDPGVIAEPEIGGSPREAVISLGALATMTPPNEDTCLNVTDRGKNATSCGNAMLSNANCSGRASSPDLAGNPSMDSFTSLAHHRRRSWTPPKNTVLTSEAGKECNEFQSPGSPHLNRSLSAVLSNFHHVPTAVEQAPSAQIAHGESYPKRRRIAPRDVSPGEQAGPKCARKPKAAPAKRIKSTKKPQTITSLATAAFRAEQLQDLEQDTISEYLARQQGTDFDRATDLGQAEVSANPDQPQIEKLVKRSKGPKKQRTDGPAKPKPKLLPTEPSSELLLPLQARACERAQNFLFGTSSQLAVDESVSFVQQLQTAINESELAMSSQVKPSPQQASCTKVPSAPHGTNLSIGQADRNLWCTAARDGAGLVVATNFDEATKESRPNAPLSHLHPEHEARELENVSKDLDGECELPLERQICVERELVNHDTSTPSELMLPPTVHTHSASGYLSQPRPELVDLISSSPLVELREEPTILSSGKTAPIEPEQMLNFQVQEVGSSFRESILDDQWMSLTSDDEPSTNESRPHPAPSAEKNDQGDLRVLNSFNAFLRPPRSALQALDANTSIHAQTFQSKEATFMQHRRLSTKTPEKRGALTPPKPRGRPRQDIPAASKRAQIKPRRRSSNVTISATVSTPRRSQKLHPNTIPPSHQPATTSVWADIDEILDSDSAATPSPPRRQASSSPPAVLPLDLQPRPQPSGTTAPAPRPAASAAVRLSDDGWATVRASVFARITQTIQSAPASRDALQPSWHEKILLYDPIVLEDLTAWLNAQALRVATPRPVERAAKDKGRGGGRRRKPLPPFETISHDPLAPLAEPLQPWMVQQWCQANSVCCLWKDGLRGGVRTRY